MYAILFKYAYYLYTVYLFVKIGVIFLRNIYIKKNVKGYKNVCKHNIISGYIQPEKYNSWAEKSRSGSNYPN